MGSNIYFAHSRNVLKMTHLYIQIIKGFYKWLVLNTFRFEAYVYSKNKRKQDF